MRLNFRNKFFTQCDRHMNRDGTLDCTMHSTHSDNESRLIFIFLIFYFNSAIDCASTLVTRINWIFFRNFLRHNLVFDLFFLFFFLRIFFFTNTSRFPFCNEIKKIKFQVCGVREMKKTLLNYRSRVIECSTIETQLKRLSWILRIHTYTHSVRYVYDLRFACWLVRV